MCSFLFFVLPSVHPSSRLVQGTRTLLSREIVANYPPSSYFNLHPYQILIKQHRSKRSIRNLNMPRIIENPTRQSTQVSRVPKGDFIPQSITYARWGDHPLTGSDRGSERDKQPIFICCAECFAGPNSVLSLFSKGQGPGPITCRDLVQRSDWIAGMHERLAVRNRACAPPRGDSVVITAKSISIVPFRFQNIGNGV